MQTLAAAAATHADVRVDEAEGLAALARLAPEWDDLVRRHPATGPFALSGWTRAWAESFRPGGRLRLFRVSAGDEAIAFVPLLERDGRVARVPFRMLESPSNAHTLRTEWALDRARAPLAIEALWHRIRDEDWEVLVLHDVVLGSTLERELGAAARRSGFLVVRRETLESPWLPVPPPGALEDTLQPKFRSNLRRRRRKLEGLGTVRLARVSDLDGLEAALESGLDLEERGWKGRAGTAIASDPRTGAFYRSLARTAAVEGWLSLYTLTVDDRPVAFQYGVEYGGRYHLPKSAYDERLSSCSPGQLVVGEVLEDLACRGVAEFDFLGPQMRWKQDWTERLRPHGRLFVFRPSVKGRLFEAGRFRYGPRAKRWLAGLARRAPFGRDAR